ncbi:hypothetical protein [Aquabacterium humicola]|uniref:hypothetical protein n=1 Tax=Aquabacterium humicola TaxID=3237377 RepID=UPI002542F770|nr:hypothetical protein [Rubrivivax pictus]
MRRYLLAQCAHRLGHEIAAVALKYPGRIDAVAQAVADRLAPHLEHGVDDLVEKQRRTQHLVIDEILQGGTAVRLHWLLADYASGVEATRRHPEQGCRARLQTTLKPLDTIF